MDNFNQKQTDNITTNITQDKTLDSMNTISEREKDMFESISSNKEKESMLNGESSMEGSAQKHHISDEDFKEIKDNKIESIEDKVNDDLDYTSYNAKINILGEDGKLQLGEDKIAIKKYFSREIKPNFMDFPSLREKLDYLIENDYYDGEMLSKYDFDFIKRVYKRCSSYNFRFNTFMGPRKFYNSYAMKTFDGEKYIENFEDRVAMNALDLADGNEELALNIVDEIMTRRYQPATPTFLNAGKKQRGSYVSCFLLTVPDNLEGIYRSATDSAQLSKRGGGVALCITDIRHRGAPIKKMEGRSSGVIPVLKLYEDTFKYVNQLGQRQGAGAAYINVHHPDILEFLDTKKENADEATRIKTLSLGVIIPDITYHLAKQNADMYLFSPYDIQKEYGVPMSEINITEMYDELVANDKISKKTINARDLFTHIAALQFESGYPYILNEDVANRAHNNPGRIKMSNLCSEILQSSTPSTFNTDGSFDEVGRDISCNLGSLNIANVMESENFAKTIETSIRALTSVTDRLDEEVDCSPSIRRGNKLSHSIGLGQMNLHGFLAKNHIHYDSEEAVDFTRNYFYAVLFQALTASNKIAMERNETYHDFKLSKYASGEFFDNKYTNENYELPTPQTDKVKSLFDDSTIHLPDRNDWIELKEKVMKYGLYHAYLQAVAPTGSISYVNESTSCIHPIVAPIEIRKDGTNGRTYVPVPYLDDDTIPYYKTAYNIDNKAIIDVYAAAQEFVDQGESLTLFYKNTDTTRDVVKTIIYAWSKGIKTIYYARVKSNALEGTEVIDANGYCESCQI